MTVLEVVALVLSACSLVMLMLLVGRRAHLAARDRRRTAIEEELRPIALRLLDADTPPPADLTVAQREALADLLGRYARAVRGASRDRIAGYFTAVGATDHERAELTGARPAWRRATAAFRLGDIGDGDAPAALIAALADRDRDVRVAAVRSLGHLRAPEAAEPLLAAAAEGRVPIALAGWALLQIGPSVLAPLRPLLAADDPAARAAVLQMLALLGGPADADEVAARLRDTSALVRTRAALALCRLGGERHLPALRQALEDRIPAVREAAADALGQLRDAAAVPALTRRALSDQFDVARAAARAVARIDLAAAAAAADGGASDHLREAVELAGVR